MEWTRRRISEPTRAWLAALPERRVDGDFSLVHGSPRDPIWEYVVSVPIARANLAILTTPFGLHGHTHLPMVWAEHDGQVEQIAPAQSSTFTLDHRRALINPGSVGQPRDGEVTASYLVIDTTRDSRPGTGSPTTSRPSRRRCSTPACRAALPIGWARPVRRR